MRTDLLACAPLLALSLLPISCAAPTLQQRQQAWERYRDATRATCLVGSTRDPAMPTDVKAWCAEVIGAP